MTSGLSQDLTRDCPLAGVLAHKLRESRRQLVQHWLERIAERVSIDPVKVFPTADLLDHVPLLIDGIADYLENPADEIGADTPVVGKAMELGDLRHRQGFDAYEILKEYEILGGILFTFLANTVDAVTEPCEKSELLICGHRLFRAIAIIQETTTVHFLRLANEKVAEREDRLRAFNRAMSHEMKNHVGAIMGAGELLDTLGDIKPEQRAKFHDIIRRRARLMRDTLDNLVILARVETDARQQRHVRLPQAAKEAARQVREAAQAANVYVRISEGLPDVEVNAAIVELSLINYLSNAIKYCDRTADMCYVEVTGSIETGERGREVLVRVRDNGLGVPPAKRDRLFERFFRAHETVTAAEGTGLGLSIVRESMEAIGGRAWAEFPERGSVFVFALPYRRAEGDRGESSGQGAA